MNQELLSFGAVLKRYRRAAELSQEELSERAGYSAVYIRKLEGGSRMPTASTVELLAHALELEPEQWQLLQQAARRLPIGEASSAVAAVSPVPANASIQTFLIADIRGYTQFTQERGDEAAARLAGQFAALGRQVVGAHGGDVVELRGDEVLAVFTSPRSALRAAVALRDRSRVHDDPSLPLLVGIGLDAGEAVPVEGGYRGGALNLAARLCSLAGAGELFASETVVGLARKVEGLAYRERGRVNLKGYAEPVSVVQVLREDELEEVSRRETYDAVFVAGTAEGRVAARLASRLEEDGRKVWISERDTLELHFVLRLTDCVLVFIGEGGLDVSLRDRLAEALDPLSEEWRPRVQLVLLPRVPDPFDPSILPSFLSTRAWIDLRACDPQAAEALVQLTRVIEGSSAGAERPVPGDAPPYQGLEAFDESTTEFFFGRAADTQRLVERLKSTSFLAVLGPSGSGKSSLVKAGLLPQLRLGAVTGSDTWTVRTFAPGAQPLAALSAQLLRLYPESTMQRTLDEMSRDSRTLHLATLLALADSLPGRRILWVIDQFEELFTLCRDESERRQFLSNLMYAVSAPEGRTTVVVTVRADFYHRCAQYPELAAQMSRRQYLVGTMDRETLRQVIEEPAWHVGLEFEHGLVDRILDDVADQPGALPLLEYALLELWNRREGRILTLEGYRESGGVSGAIAQRAETTFARFNPEEQSTTRLALLRLTQAGEGTADMRRRVAMSELLTLSGSAEAMERMINALVNARLLTAGRDGGSEDGERQVEVSHEALIRGWPRLRRWIDEDRAGLRIHRRLTEATQEWERIGRDSGALYRGATLAVAAEWTGRNSGALNRLEREFLEASVKLQERERRAARRRIWLAAGGLVTALVLISIAAVVASVQRQQAVHDADAARSSYFAQEATQQLSNDRRLSTLLAVEAVDVSPTIAAVTALRDALAAFPPLVRLTGHADIVNTAFFSPDSRRIVTASADGTARIWDVGSGRVVRVLRGTCGPLNDAEFSSNGQEIVTAGAKGTACIWNAAGGREVRVLRGDGRALRSADFSPDGRLILTAGVDHLARLWDAASGRLLRTLRGHTLPLTWAIFDPSGKTAVTTSDDGTARIWNVRTGRRLGTLSVPGEDLTFAAFSPNSDTMLSGGNGPLRLWNLKTGRPVEVLDISSGTVATPGGFSPDGRWIVAGSLAQSGTAAHAVVWDAGTGNALIKLTGHTDSINSAAFSPNDRWLATASSDGTVLIRGCDVCGSLTDLLGLAASKRYPPLTATERRRFVSQP